MTSLKNKLAEKFKEENRYSNFGALIKSMIIDGFRGIYGLEIDFEYPITAISGTNGSGKSTIGQLAICAYKQPSTHFRSKKRYYIKDFFPVSPLDPTPFTVGANVKFRYATTNTNHFQDLTVSRKTSEWSGYTRQPERHSFYVGFTIYIPKVERRDLSVSKPGSFLVGKKRSISDNIKAQVSRILNNEYREVSFQEITHQKQKIELGLVQKYDYSYSENNMGFGEGRLIYIIDLLENEPNNSLFILEEPETSLHEDAQYKFIQYLMDVCNRKGHQIILSTHSSIILDALPPEGRKFIMRNKDGVKILDRVSSNRAKSILTDGNSKALKICVEDEFAKLKLREAIRIYNPLLLPLVEIFPIGDKKGVAKVVELLREKMNIKVIGVRDADVGEDNEKKIFKLPGDNPPEREVYEMEEVQNSLNKTYNIDIKTIFSHYSDIDHHQYGKILSERAFCSEETMNIEAIKAYLKVFEGDGFAKLIQKIEQEI